MNFETPYALGSNRQTYTLLRTSTRQFLVVMQGEIQTINTGSVSSTTDEPASPSVLRVRNWFSAAPALLEWLLPLVPTLGSVATPARRGLPQWKAWSLLYQSRSSFVAHGPVESVVDRRGLRHQWTWRLEVSLLSTAGPPAATASGGWARDAPGRGFGVVGGCGVAAPRVEGGVELTTGPGCGVVWSCTGRMALGWGATRGAGPDGLRELGRRGLAPGEGWQGRDAGCCCCCWHCLPLSLTRRTTTPALVTCAAQGYYPPTANRRRATRRPMLASPRATCWPLLGPHAAPCWPLLGPHAAPCWPLPGPYDYRAT